MHESHNATENTCTLEEITLTVTPARALVSWSHPPALNCPDEWDWGKALVVHPNPNREPGAHVSMRVSRHEFGAIDIAAKKSGKELTEFVRDAALAAAART